MIPAACQDRAYTAVCVQSSLMGWFVPADADSMSDLPGDAPRRVVGAREERTVDGGTEVIYTVEQKPPHGPTTSRDVKHRVMKLEHEQLFDD